MGFFKDQQSARRYTVIFLFAFSFIAFAAFLLTCMGIFFAALALLIIAWAHGDSNALHEGLRLWWNFVLAAGPVLVTIGGVFFVVVAWTKYKVLQQGGESVARFLKAKHLYPCSSDPNEIKAVHAMEEICVAANIPALPLYVLEDEKSINAMAAGFGVKDGVVILTKGAVRLLTRDELQGVIAHEISHVLDGDSALNMWLVVILHALKWPNAIVERYERERRRRRDDYLGLEPVEPDEDTGMLMVYISARVGYPTVMLAEAIQAAISRQREFLADAKAVQLTRQPLGLLGALKKIALLEDGAEVREDKSQAVSHFFFADCRDTHFYSFLNTHPPLESRMERLDGGFTLEDGVWTYEEMESRFAEREPETSGDVELVLRDPVGRAILFKGRLFDPVLKKALDGASDSSDEHEFSAPQTLLKTLQDPFGARAFFYSMLLVPEGEEDVRMAQLDLLRNRHCDEYVRRRLREQMEVLSALETEKVSKIADLAFYPLIYLSELERREFRENIIGLSRVSERRGTKARSREHQVIARVLQVLDAPAA